MSVGFELSLASRIQFFSPNAALTDGLDTALQVALEQTPYLSILSRDKVRETTASIGLSFALGAFVGGLLLGSSDFAHKLARKALPIRDAFVALFFVTIGMLIDPSTWLSNWHLLAIMVGLILIGKFVVWFTVVRLFGYSTQTAWRVGFGLTQIGEFSFILAQVAMHSGLIGPDVYNATLAASLVTILANAGLFKFMKPAPVAIRPTFAIVNP
jgi:predicted Kef-type K+ transport protein